MSEEKARKREEKYQDQIKQLNIRLKQADSRFLISLSTEPVFLNLYAAQESIPRNEFRQPT